MRKFLLLLVALFSTLSLSAQSSVNIVSQDSLSVDVRELWELGETNIFNDPRTPRFVMASKDQNYLFGVGGYVEARGFYDFTGFGEDGLYIGNLSVPYNSEVPDKMGFMASGSKLIFKMLGNTKFGIIETTFETGFKSTSYTMYLSRAYIRFGSFLVGQDWSVTTDINTFPTVLDGADPLAKFGYKVPQIRYTLAASNLLKFYFSLEFPTLTYQYNSADYYIADLTPDFDTKVFFRGSGGLYSGQVAGVVRIIEPDVAELSTTRANTKVGYGLTTAHQFKFGKHTLYGGASVGVGVNDLFAGLNSLNINLLEAYNPTTEQFSLVASSAWGLIGSYRVAWSENSESNLVASYIKVSDWTLSGGKEILRTDIPEELLGLSVNYIYTLEENMIIGAEALFGTKTLYNGGGDKGYGARLGFLLRYNF